VIPREDAPSFRPDRRSSFGEESRGPEDCDCRIGKALADSRVCLLFQLGHSSSRYRRKGNGDSAHRGHFVRDRKKYFFDFCVQPVQNELHDELTMPDARHRRPHISTRDAPISQASMPLSPQKPSPQKPPIPPSRKAFPHDPILGSGCILSWNHS
jgi:hypothetical protein